MWNSFFNRILKLLVISVTVRTNVKESRSDCSANLASIETTFDEVSIDRIFDPLV